MSKRLKAMGDPHYQNDGDPRTSGPGFASTVHPDRLELPLRWKRPRRVFVNSMSDLFHDDIPDEFIARVFGVMAAASNHTFQILTKRHARMRSLLSSESFYSVANYATTIAADSPCYDLEIAGWPLPNVWLGVSVETQQWADIRVPALLDTPAAVRFLSCEPLLGPVDLHPFLPGPLCDECEKDMEAPMCDDCHRRIDWVIVGGESGREARPMVPQWARDIRDQCVAASVPFLFKQFGEWAPNGSFGVGRPGPRCLYVPGKVKDPAFPGFHEQIERVGKKAAGRVLDGREWNQYPA